MHPLAMLLGILMGSAVSITVALTLTLVVFMMLPEYSDRIGEEFPPLLGALAGSASLAALAGAAFLGELRSKPWRRPVQALLFLLIAGVIGWYWPEGK
jgi:drug/metabolite transporter (DMT)-like permease